MENETGKMSGGGGEEKRRARLPALLSFFSPITYHFQRHLDWNLIFLVGTHLLSFSLAHFASPRGERKNESISSTLVKKGMLCSQTTQCRRPAASHLEGQFVKNNESWLACTRRRRRALLASCVWRVAQDPITLGECGVELIFGCVTLALSKTNNWEDDAY